MMILASYTPAHSTEVLHAKGPANPAKPRFIHMEGVTTTNTQDAMTLPRLLELPRPPTPGPRPGPLPPRPPPNPTPPPSPRYSLSLASDTTSNRLGGHIAIVGYDIKPLTYPRPPRPPTPGPNRPGPIGPRPDVPTPPPTPRHSLEIGESISTLIRKLTAYFSIDSTDGDTEMSPQLGPEASNESIGRKRLNSASEGHSSTGFPRAGTLSSKPVVKKVRRPSYPPRDISTWEFKLYQRYGPCCEICSRGPSVRDRQPLEIIVTTPANPNLVDKTKSVKLDDPSRPKPQLQSPQPCFDNPGLNLNQKAHRPNRTVEVQSDRTDMHMHKHH
ncbi:hypothetical protein GGR57DRAFT_310018 [Xylariaceae sp. FL1272]|nr:hypothetical protein GGR57DRAFT_310018 [Xylariaceae sp. FL1272]